MDGGRGFALAGRCETTRQPATLFHRVFTMLRSVILTLIMAGTCVGQPPSSTERFNRLVTLPRPDFEGDRRRLIEHSDWVIEMLENKIKQVGRVLRKGNLTPAAAKDFENGLNRMRKLIPHVTRTRDKLLAQAAKAKTKPIPVAPMPREKRID
jgi:hypothetical protein